jgi:hypothetical protein
MLDTKEVHAEFWWGSLFGNVHIEEDGRITF